MHPPGPTTAMGQPGRLPATSGKRKSVPGGKDPPKQALQTPSLRHPRTCHRQERSFFYGSKRPRLLYLLHLSPFISHLCARRIPCPIQTPLQRRMVSLLFYPIQNWMGRASRSKPSRANQTGVRYLDLIKGISTQELRSDAEHGLYRVNRCTTSSSV